MRNAQKERALQALQAYCTQVLDTLDTSIVVERFFKETKRQQADLLLEEEDTVVTRIQRMYDHVLYRATAEQNAELFVRHTSACGRLGATIDEVGLAIFQALLRHPLYEQLQREICAHSGLPLAPEDKDN